MRTERFSSRCKLPAPASEVYSWHCRPGAFQRLAPPWEKLEILDRGEGVREGSRVVLRVGRWPARVTWIAEHHDIEEGRQFRDRQVRGPFGTWDHLHRMEPDGPSACTLLDEVEYALPFGAAGRLLAGRRVARAIDRLFRFRHSTTREDIAAHTKYRGDATMKILVSGSSGLVGSALVPFLTTAGHEVTRLVRRQAREGEVSWDPSRRRIDREALNGFDAVVHLAGENIAEGRWNDAKKARIRESRVGGTTVLAEALAGLKSPPRTLVCASAIGFYGDRGEEVLDEGSARGSGFLSDVCAEWEAASAPASASGIRVAQLRFGVILSPAEGALKKMLLPFKLGVGGRIGDGSQYMSWISIDDAIGAVLHALSREPVDGPVNAVAPEPVTNAQYTETLGRVLSRPAIFPMPSFAARLVFGEMADALLLASVRVVPGKLRETGYEFRHASLEAALRHLLGRA